MPLSQISERSGALGAFTYRELLAERRRLEKALARGRPGAKGEALLNKIDDELSARRSRKFARAGGPALP